MFLVVEVEEEGHCSEIRQRAEVYDSTRVDLFDEMAAAAEDESPLWAAALRPVDEREREPIFSPLAPEEFALGLETVYEAYLVHYGYPRLFAPGEDSERVLLGDYLYAHGLVRISAAGGVNAVATMAELISRCASLRAAGEAGDGEAWLVAARALGGQGDSEAETAALRMHATRVGEDASRIQA
jgi:hypothetical protein